MRSTATPIMTTDRLFGIIIFARFCAFFLGDTQKTAFVMPNVYAIKIPKNTTLHHKDL